ncbi:DUF4085 family protein [Oceanobacillus bengalensis]|uniref:DUF4085 family protein n=1 Tax=Oceanobacillus bengalensis TaxID=1435466 RepID=A0A494Z484_9BACI|nr:DUF4085 family protein [Oceanobacillus bengalensis]RKQ17123.1 DUF4085 family protein [Oceanobacillus bengalensis]
MWNITKEAKGKFSRCNLLPIHESDHDWEIVLREAEEEGEDIIAALKADLLEVKEELLQILPDCFIPYVENGTLNQPTLPKTIRENYLQWMREADREFEQVLDAAHENTAHAVRSLPAAVQEVFNESLHDSIIERIEREGDTLHLYINTESGFQTKSMIHFTFRQIRAEDTDDPIQVGQWLVYNELQKTGDSFHFRVLFDSPEAEWTITMKHLDAEYFYRPCLYTVLQDEGKMEETSFSEFLAQLNPEHDYWFITPHVTCAIKELSENIVIENGNIEWAQNKMVVTVGKACFTYALDAYNPIEFIYTNVYEDPYAHQNEPVAMDELEQAALSDDIELQVRAWNTMYTNPKELADIINCVLYKMEITEENEMIRTVYVNHFYKEGILTESIIEKYHTIID